MRGIRVDEGVEREAIPIGFALGPHTNTFVLRAREDVYTYLSLLWGNATMAIIGHVPVAISSTALHRDYNLSLTPPTSIATSNDPTCHPWSSVFRHLSL